MTLFVIEPAKIVAPAPAVASPAVELTVTLLPAKRVFVTVPPIAPAAEEPAAFPCERPSVDTLTLLFVITSLLNSTLTSVCTPPEKASASPTVLVMIAELPEIVVLRIEPAAWLEMWMPPATASRSTLFGSAAFSVALLFVTELPVIVSVPPSAKIAPESANRPFGAVALHVALLDWDEARVDVPWFDFAHIPDDIAVPTPVDRDVLITAGVAWEAATCWVPEPDYSRRRMAELRERLRTEPTQSRQ